MLANKEAIPYLDTQKKVTRKSQRESYDILESGKEAEVEEEEAKNDRRRTDIYN